jgi:hypothetical protein
MYTTNAEAAKQTQMCTIYNKAWGNAKKSTLMAGGKFPKVDDSQGGFDVKA